MEVRSKIHRALSELRVRQCNVADALQYLKRLAPLTPEECHAIKAAVARQSRLWAWADAQARHDTLDEKVK